METTKLINPLQSNQPLIPNKMEQEPMKIDTKSSAFVETKGNETIKENAKIATKFTELIPKLSDKQLKEFFSDDSKAYSDNEEKIKIYRNNVDAIMIEVGKLQALAPSPEKFFSLNKLDMECVRIGNLLGNLISLVALRIFIFKFIDPLLIKAWSEVARDLVLSWECIRTLCLKRADRGQFTICRFVKDLMYSSY